MFKLDPKTTPNPAYWNDKKLKTTYLGKYCDEKSVCGECALRCNHTCSEKDFEEFSMVELDHFIDITLGKRPIFSTPKREES